MNLKFFIPKTSTIPKYILQTIIKLFITKTQFFYNYQLLFDICVLFIFAICMLLLCILIRCTWYHTWWANSKLQCTSKYEHLASNARREWRPAGLELMHQKSLDPKYSYTLTLRGLKICGKISSSLPCPPIRSSTPWPPNQPYS